MSAGVIVISESEDESIPTASKRSRWYVQNYKS